MALMECPNCGKGISEKSFKCLYCDFTIEDNAENGMAENITQENLSSPKRDVGKLDYKNIGIMSIAFGCLAWTIGFIKLFSDTYDFILNIACFSGLIVVGATLILSGVLVMIYVDLKEIKSKVE